MTGGRVVLYVGDDSDRVSALRSASDWDVDHAETVGRAYERVADADCLVVEQRLPDGTGIEFCRRVRERNPDCPLVLVPATGDDDLAREAVALGIDEYLPAGTISDPAELRDVIARVLDSGDTERSRYRKLVEQTTDVISVVDPDGTFQYISPAIEGMTGYSHAALVGEDVFEYIHPEDVEQVRDAFEQCLGTSGETIAREFRVQQPDGSISWVEARARNFVDDPDIGGVVVSSRDITDRKERQRELELYETMLNAVPDMVYALDDSGEIVALNDTFETETDLTQEDVLGSHISLGMSEADLQRGRAHIRELLTDDDREKAIFEMEFHTATGDPIPVENHIALMTGADGSFRGSVGVLRNISDRKRRERRLTVLNRALRHDLRNSMHVILANAELVERAVSDPDLTSKLRTVRRRAEKITGLSEKAREIEQTIGERALPRKRLDLAVLLTDQIARFREQYPDATIEADLPDHAWVQAIELVDVAVENLIENSLEHTDDQHVEVGVDVGPDTVSVTVTDDGPGIPAKERRIVGQGSETPLDHASGLGLWLVAWITRDSEGDVVFEDGGDVRLVLDRADPEPRDASEMDTRAE
ncbi:PAS domain S-box protein [Halorientalis salina]|uniref:PAS domain S-box protein n=1 Tax=Halorientalis salina TaxID=2932266 RepID=UPI0010AD8030|nr:PAS domain S-box protein [Halorientalis salina]